jgi:hypothetical protein
MTFDKEGLASLLERVRAAKGPDRQLDRDIQKALDIGPTSFTHDEFNHWPLHVTASIDASLALVERLLPGWVVADLSQNSRHAGDPWGCKLAIYYGSTPSRNREVSSGHDFPKAPLAILTAMLTALNKDVR